MKAKPTIPDKPKIPEYYYVIPVGDDRLQFRTGARVVRLGGKTVSRLFPKLLPFLNGRYEVSEIISELKEFKKDTVLAVLAVLTQKGLLQDATITPPFEMSSQELERYSHHFAFFSHFSDDRYECQGILKEARVVVWGLGQIGSQVVSSLAACGVGEIRAIGNGIVEERDVGSFYTENEVGKKRCEAAQLSANKINPHIKVEPFEAKAKSAQDVAPLIDGADLVVVCTDSPAILVCRWVNEACLEKGIRWTSATLNERRGVIGPSIVPFETACYTCYELRTKANEAFYQEYLAFERYIEDNPDLVREFGSFLPLSKMVGNYVAWEAVKILTNLTFPATYGRTCTIDFLTLETDIEQVLKLPYCPTCGQVQPKPTLWLEE